MATGWNLKLWTLWAIWHNFFIILSSKVKFYSGELLRGQSESSIGRRECSSVIIPGVRWIAIESWQRWGLPGRVYWSLNDWAKWKLWQTFEKGTIDWSGLDRNCYGYDVKGKEATWTNRAAIWSWDFVLWRFFFFGTRSQTHDLILVRQAPCYWSISLVCFGDLMSYNWEIIWEFILQF